MLVMVVFFIAFRWIHLSTPLIRLILLVLILLLMPTLNFLPVWFALSLLRFGLPSRLPMMFILWMVAILFQAEDGIRDLTVTGVQTCALPISLASARIIFGRVKASDRKIASGQRAFTSRISHSQNGSGLVCGLSTRKLRTP